MQDLLTGQFVDPMTLAICNVVYIIGTGSAAESFSMFPLASKGKTAYSILLQDIESQLGIQRAQRVSLTNMLAQALDNFSRLTWMGLMQEERGELRVPHPPNAFYKLQRRTVQREIMPSFLENVFSPASRLAGRDTGADGANPSLAATTPAKSSRRLEEYIASIFNTTERLDREKALKDDLTQCKTLFITIDTAGITAARRSDNPFSDNNGLVSAETQYWNSLALFNTPPIHVKSAKENEVGGFSDFLEADGLIPDDFPIGPSSASNTKTRATNGVIVAWDAKRVLLFLRHSKKLRQFLLNGGRVWCAQYAQYILKGFNHHHLSSMERTLLQYHAGPIKTPLHPLAKLKLIYETQLNLAMQTRQLLSTAARMDGLLASAEMEKNGLQLVPQDEVTTFSNNLKLDHDRLEKVLQEKVFDFTRHMDDDVRQRINFRSPQDISTIIYGGALCRHLGSRFVPVRPARFPMTSLFPHAICKVTGCAVPAEYLDPKTLLGESQVGENYAHTFGAAEVNNALDRIHKISVKLQLEHLRHSTAVVVVIAKSRIGGFIEQFSLYCPGQAGSSEPEINVHVAVEDILPVTEKPDLVTISQLKKMIKAYKPLQHLQPLKKYGKKSYEVRNVLVLTSCNHDRLEPLVDSGIMTAIEETVLGPRAGGEEIPFERICFADLQKAFPPVAQDNDSFESDFSELTGVTSLTFSAKENWEANTGGPNAAGGYEEIFGGLVSHCASAIGTPRDAFRNSHPVPSALPRGIHGQEQASTDGMLWLVTPPNLHPLLRKFLAGKAASSGADAMERVTVLLSPYKEVDLTFFTALQQLRFTEKKMQLFEEGCLFRAVLPENHDRVHGELCHCVTATGRLSSQSPNLQNIPKEQDLRRLLVSRFGKKGRMIEADYSQLEVVVLAALSRDAKMLEELREKVDFHCMRVSLMTKEPYAEVVKKAKVEKDPHYVQLRQQAKVFSFQRQYGAGVATISTTTGLTEEEVDRLIAAEEKHYRDLNKYYRLVTDCVEGGADRLLRMRSLDLWDAPSRRIVMLTEPLHYFVVPTGSKFDFSKDRKSVPKLKNYPVQGLAGEIVQIMCGRIVRHFFEKKNYSNKAFLVNTVHDCVWVDCHEDVAKEVEADLQTLMTSTQTVMGTLFPELKLDVEFGVEVKSGQSLGEL
ncbi:mitochondrial DNA polymerase I protein C [Angomonas deanei]|uniref:DNA polymerase family A, putative n=1 Tax=Angomonas deanei TaxID=59799 RepID=A0A7G2CHV1_9TRYP|nr:mitochondrial DNA polymerase I protein C [Angomonas deanei]CAD2219326.1 DNA polymerase family A, putative [Angomonas deanei]|eukprot:EPY26363.1 mitochondrial DNA polymerase I protein C [Angomonas deanei]